MARGPSGPAYYFCCICSCYSARPVLGASAPQGDSYDLPLPHSWRAARAGQLSICLSCFIAPPLARGLSSERALRRRPSTMIHSGTLCIQGKVTKFPCFGGLVFRAQFQDFLSAFWRSFFATQLAFVSMITITPTLSLSVFSLQRTRLFPTCGELWRTCGELWLYFEMQRRLDLWSFSWSSRRSREAQK